MQATQDYREQLFMDEAHTAGAVATYPLSAWTGAPARWRGARCAMRRRGGPRVILPYHLLSRFRFPAARGNSGAPPR